LHAALLLNPIGISVAEIGEQDGALEHSAELAGKRWLKFANRFQKPLDIFRVAFPAMVLFLTLNSMISCGGPVGSRTFSAMRTGAGVNQKGLRQLLADFDSDAESVADRFEVISYNFNRGRFELQVRHENGTVYRVTLGGVRHG